MNDPNFVQFKKERDLGAMITDTFKFFRLEWKPFFTSIIKVAIIPIIIAIVAVIFYTSSFSSFFEGFAYGSYNAYGDEPEIENIGIFVFALLAFIIAYLIAYALVTVSSLSYIKSYIENTGLVNFEDVGSSAKENFWSYVGLLFLNGRAGRCWWLSRILACGHKLETALPGAKTTADRYAGVSRWPQRPRWSVCNRGSRPHRNRAAADRGSGKSGFPELRRLCK